MKFITTTFVLMVVALLVVGCGEGGRQSAIPVVHLASDTIFFTLNGEPGFSPLDVLNRYDTTTLTDDMRFGLLSGDDTVYVEPDTVARELLLIRGSDTIFETVVFVSSPHSRLRDYPHFAAEPAAAWPAFAYQATGDSSLSALREKYQLEAVAGSGDELSRIRNLLFWANKIVRHDGDKDPADPDPRNADNIIQTCQATGKGVNCRMMATMLNEAFLAMGFKSRHITCLPYDTTDPDCHVINAVYSETLGKWLWADPTFAGYAMDDQGNWLSIAEVRERLILGDAVRFNDELNWNGAPKHPEEYKTYMTKNLFRFMAPLVSEYGYESRNGDRSWVYLYPVGYAGHQAGAADTTQKETGAMVNIHTTDADYFWTKP